MILMTHPNPSVDFSTYHHTPELFTDQNGQPVILGGTFYMFGDGIGLKAVELAEMKGNTLLPLGTNATRSAVLAQTLDILNPQQYIDAVAASPVGFDGRSMRTRMNIDSMDFDITDYVKLSGNQIDPDRIKEIENLLLVWASNGGHGEDPLYTGSQGTLKRQGPNVASTLKGIGTTPRACTLQTHVDSDRIHIRVQIAKTTYIVPDPADPIDPATGLFKTPLAFCAGPHKETGEVQYSPRSVQRYNEMDDNFSTLKHYLQAKFADRPEDLALLGGADLTVLGAPRPGAKPGPAPVATTSPTGPESTLNSQTTAGSAVKDRNARVDTILEVGQIDISAALREVADAEQVLKAKQQQAELMRQAQNVITETKMFKEFGKRLISDITYELDKSGKALELNHPVTSPEAAIEAFEAYNDLKVSQLTDVTEKLATAEAAAVEAAPFVDLGREFNAKLAELREDGTTADLKAITPATALDSHVTLAAVEDTLISREVELTSEGVVAAIESTLDRLATAEATVANATPLLTALEQLKEDVPAIAAAPTVEVAADIIKQRIKNFDDVQKAGREKAELADKYLRENDKLKADIKPLQDFESAKALYAAQGVTVDSPLDAVGQLIAVKTEVKEARTAEEAAKNAAAENAKKLEELGTELVKAREEAKAATAKGYADASKAAQALAKAVMDAKAEAAELAKAQLEAAVAKAKDQVREAAMVEINKLRAELEALRNQAPAAPAAPVRGVGPATQADLDARQITRPTANPDNQPGGPEIDPENKPK